MTKKLRIEITPSGKIQAKTLGMYDEECLDYVEIIEQLTDSVAIDSEFTEEYLRANVKHHVNQRQELKRK